MKNNLKKIKKHKIQKI